MKNIVFWKKSYVKNILIKWLMVINTLLIRISGGRLGSRIYGQDVLILHTTGRKSGLQRAIPIAYFRDGQNFFIVASNWARDKHADWYFNLKSNPQASLEVFEKKIPVIAHEAVGDEFANLWKIASKLHPQYLAYQKNTSRRIPIMVFKPVD